MFDNEKINWRIKYFPDLFDFTILEYSKKKVIDIVTENTDFSELEDFLKYCVKQKNLDWIESQPIYAVYKDGDRRMLDRSEKRYLYRIDGYYILNRKEKVTEDQKSSEVENYRAGLKLMEEINHMAWLELMDEVDTLEKVNLKDDDKSLEKWYHTKTQFYKQEAFEIQQWFFMNGLSYPSRYLIEMDEIKELRINYSKSKTKPMRISNRTQKRYSLIYEKYRYWSDKKESWTRMDIYIHISALKFDGKLYSWWTVRDIIEKKKYLK